MEKYNIPEEEYKNLKIQGIKQKLNEIISDDFFANMLDEVDEDFDLDLDLELEESMDGLFDSELMKLLIDGPKFGIDFYFLDKAKILNKEVGELESIESQMDLLFGGGLFEDFIGHISEEEEIKILEEVLEAFDKEGNILEEEFENDEKLYEEIEQILQGQLDQELNMLKEMFDAIKLGDSEKLAKAFMESEGAGMLGGELMGQRDKNMAKKIAGLLEGEGEKTYFIVVGAAHFVVDGTILDNLIDMGYEIEEIK